MSLGGSGVSIGGVRSLREKTPQESSSQKHQDDITPVRIGNP